MNGLLVLAALWLFMSGRKRRDSHLHHLSAGLVGNDAQGWVFEVSGQVFNGDPKLRQELAVGIFVEDVLTGAVFSGNTILVEAPKGQSGAFVRHVRVNRREPGFPDTTGRTVRVRVLLQQEEVATTLVWRKDEQIIRGTFTLR